MYIFTNAVTYMVLLKCNVVLARMYFPRILILDTLLSTSTHINSTRVERGVKSDVKDSIGLTRSLEGVSLCRSSD